GRCLEKRAGVRQGQHQVRGLVLALIGPFDARKRREGGSIVISKGIMALGLIALVACAGCASGPRSARVHNAALVAPASFDDTQQCETDGGWYDRAAHACDAGGT